MTRRRTATLIAPLLALWAGSTAADPGYYLVTPYDQAGMWGAEVRYWTVASPRFGIVKWPELGLSYGINSRWTTRVFASWIGNQLDAQKLSSWNWQNLVMLTQGELPFDLGLHLQAIHEQGQGNAFEFGPAWQTDLGRLRLNANLIASRAHGDSHPELKLQWRGLYRVAPGWRLGVEGFGELGPWNDWLPGNRQSHRAGPALQATLLDTAGGQLEFKAAYLWGKTYGSRGNMFSTQLQWLW